MVQATQTLPPFSPELCLELVGRIRSAIQPARIILFGSAARNEMTPDSDVDVMVVLPKLEPEKKRETWWTIKQATWGFPFPLDILLIDQKVFEENRDRVGSMAYPVSREGRVIYGG